MPFVCLGLYSCVFRIINRGYSVIGVPVFRYSTGGHWELPSQTAVFYWWTLGASQSDCSFLLVDTGSCPVQPQSSTGGHWELPSTTAIPSVAPVEPSAIGSDDCGLNENDPIRRDIREK